MVNISNFNHFDYSGSSANKLLGVLLILVAIVVSAYTSTVIWIEKRTICEKLSYKPITEEDAQERTYLLKTSIPTELKDNAWTKAKLTVPAGTNVKVLGAYMTRLNYRTDIYSTSAPWVYSPDQYFWIEMPDGTQGAARLPEALVGRKIVIKSGEQAGQTVTVTGVKKNKSNDKFPYDYSVEGSKTTYKWGEFTPLNKDVGEMVVYTNPLSGAFEKDKHKAAHVPSFIEIPTHEDNGYFLFPRYKKWNMYKILPWWRGRIMLTVYWLILMVLVLWWLGAKSTKLSVKAQFDYMDNPAYSSKEVYDKAVRYYWPRYYIRAFIVGCIFSPLVWLWTKINRSAMISSLKNELGSERCPKCAERALAWKYTGKETPWTYLRTVYTGKETYTERSSIQGEKVYDTSTGQMRDRQKITTTTYDAGSHDVYVRRKEYQVYCKHCKAILRTDWEEETRSQNYQGGDVLSESSRKESVTYGYVPKK